MIKNKHVEFKDLAKLANTLKKKGRRVVFTTGSFELITPGHCRFLAEAKALGDTLVVGLCSDRSITKIKGPDFPLLNQSARMEMLGYLKSVDYLTIIDEGEPHTSIVLLEPDIFYVSQKELNNGNVDEQALFLLKKRKGKLMIRKDDHPYKSARDLIEHVANIRFLEIVAGYLWAQNIAFDLNAVANFKPADYGQQVPNNAKAFRPADYIFRDADKLCQKLQKTGCKKPVFVSGSFDLLHVGHARFVEQAAKLGDCLIVGIPSDEKIRAKKGYGRPIINEFSRAYVLVNLLPVNYVYIFDDETVAPALRSLKPAVFFTVDEDWNKGVKKSAEYKIVKDYGGKVVLKPRQSPYLSSSTMINKMAYKKVKEIFGDCLQDDKFKAMLQENGRMGPVKG
ncbi:adenylyltransferase/cytidyltransferase family protein [Patescibacteria group bacterium]|nr:adenylyltransferase/cytidyltransferase family protein [Patescibacteria group bacterium]